jgi:DNA-3-methyladenine glycosylase II
MCTVTGTIEAPAMQVTVAREHDQPAIATRVRTMFVTAPEALTALVAADPVMARLEARYRGVRPVLQFDLWAALIRAISAQQVNLRWAATTRQRLVRAYGQQYALGAYDVFTLPPARLAQASVADLRALQFTTRKAEYIVALAATVAEGQLDLEALRQQPDDVVIQRLTAQRGLGRWSAEWFLARALGRPRVVAGDLGVRKGIAAAYLQGRMPSETEVRHCTSHWGEAAGIAQQLLLHALSAGMP